MNVFELVTEDDLVSLTCLIAILFIVGRNMADARVRLWGWRAAAIGYVGFVIYAVGKLAPAGAADLAYIAFRGLFAGGLTVSVAWIVLSIALFFRDELANVERRLVVDRSPPQTAPSQTNQEQERLDQEARDRQAAEALNDQKQTHIKRVEDLRLQCEAHYRRHFEKVQSALPEQRFKEVLDTYLPKQADPATAEARSKIVIELIDALAGGESAVGEFTGLEQLIEHYAKRGQALDELGLEDDELDTLRSYVDSARYNAIQRFLEQ